VRVQRGGGPLGLVAQHVFVQALRLVGLDREVALGLFARRHLLDQAELLELVQPLAEDVPGVAPHQLFQQPRVAVEVHDPEQAPVVRGNRCILRFPGVAAGFCEAVDAFAHRVSICRQEGDFPRLAEGIVPQKQQIVERLLRNCFNLEPGKGEPP
jgi:hypothetical protein